MPKNLAQTGGTIFPRYGTPGEDDFAHVAELLRENGWDKERTKTTLIQCIAPHVAANLGYGIWPVIGEWAGFNSEWLCKRVHRSFALRKRLPAWYFLISDWWLEKLVWKCGLNKLLDKLNRENLW